MGIFQNNLLAGAGGQAAAGGGAFYDHQIEQSARFDRATPSSMNFTPGSAGNRQVWTWSAWVKKTINPGTEDVMLLNAGTSGHQSSRFRAYFYEEKFRSSSAEVNYNVSTALFRDISGWMHLVWKLTGGTSYQYVNGTEVSTSSVSGDVAINNNVKHTLGAIDSPSTSSSFDGYMAEVVFIDGTAYNPTTFAESKNGVWIPKDFSSSVTFGSQGWHLKFENASDLGNDSSGNNNDWTVVNMGTDHQIADSPTFGS